MKFNALVLLAIAVPTAGSASAFSVSPSCLHVTQTTSRSSSRCVCLFLCSFALFLACLPALLFRLIFASLSLYHKPPHAGMPYLFYDFFL